MTEAQIKLAEAYGIIRSVAYIMRGYDEVDLSDLADLLEDKALPLLDDVRGET